MSILDSVINPADLRTLDPAVRRKIVAGVEAGARSAAAIEAKQKFSPAIARDLASQAKVTVADFRKTLRKE
jgi:hypothetical protein